MTRLTWGKYKGKTAEYMINKDKKYTEYFIENCPNELHRRLVHILYRPPPEINNILDNIYGL